MTSFLSLLCGCAGIKRSYENSFDNSSPLTAKNECSALTASKARLNKPTDCQSLPALTVPVFNAQVHASLARRRSSSNFDNLAPLLEDISLAPVTAGEGNGPDSLWNTSEIGRSSCPTIAAVGGPLGKGPNQCGATPYPSHRSYAIARSSRNTTTVSPVLAAATTSPVSPMRHDFMTLIRQASNRASFNGAVPDYLPAQPHAICSLPVAPDGCRASCGSTAIRVDWPNRCKIEDGAGSDCSGGGRDASGVLTDKGAHHRRQRRASAFAATAVAPGCTKASSACTACILADCCCCCPRPTCPNAPFARCSSSPDIWCGGKSLLIQADNGEMPGAHDGCGSGDAGGEGGSPCTQLLPTTSHLAAGCEGRAVKGEHGGSQLSSRCAYTAKTYSREPRLVQLPLSPLRPRDLQHTHPSTSPSCTTMAATQLSLRCSAPWSCGSGGGAPAATGIDNSQLSPSVPASIIASSGVCSYQNGRLISQLREQHEAQLLQQQRALGAAEAEAGQQGRIPFAAVTAPSEEPSASTIERPTLPDNVGTTVTDSASGTAAHREPCGGSCGPCTQGNIVGGPIDEESLSLTGTSCQLQTSEALLAVTRLLEANTLPNSTLVDPMCEVSPSKPDKQWAAGGSSAPGTAALVSFMSTFEGGHASGSSVAAACTFQVQTSMSPGADTPPLPLLTSSSQPGPSATSVSYTAAGQGDVGRPTSKGSGSTPATISRCSRPLARPEPWDLLLTSTHPTYPTALVNAAATSTGTPRGPNPRISANIRSPINDQVCHYHLPGPLPVANITTSVPIVAAAASTMNTHPVAGCLVDSSSHADGSSMAHEAMGWFETCTSSKSGKTAPVSASSLPQSGGAVASTGGCSMSAATSTMNAVLSSPALPSPPVVEPRTLRSLHRDVTTHTHAASVRVEVVGGHPSFPLLTGPASLLSTPDVLHGARDSGGGSVPAASLRSLSGQPSCIPVMTATNPITAAAIMAPPDTHVGLSVLTSPCDEAIDGVSSSQCPTGSCEVPYSLCSTEAYSGSVQGMIRSPSHARGGGISGGGNGRVGPCSRSSVSASRRDSYIIASETSLTALAFLRAASAAVTLPDHEAVQLCDAAGSVSGVSTGAGGGAVIMPAWPSPLLLPPLTPSSPRTILPSGPSPSPHQHHYHEQQQQQHISVDMGRVAKGGAGGVPSLPADGSISTSAAAGLRLEDGLVPEPHMLVEGLGRLSYMTSGAYAAVYKGTWEGMPVGVKFLASTSLDPCAPAVKEALLGPGLDHGNIIHTYTTRLARIDARALEALKATVAAQAGRWRKAPVGALRRRSCVAGNTVLTETPESAMASPAPAAAGSISSSIPTSTKSSVQIAEMSASVGGRPSCASAATEFSLNAISSANSSSCSSQACQIGVAGTPSQQVLPASHNVISPAAPIIVRVAEACPALASPMAEPAIGRGGGTVSAAKGPPAVAGGAAARHIFLRRSISANARGPHGSSTDTAAGMHHHHPPPTSPLRPSLAVLPQSPQQQKRSLASRQGLLQKEESGGGVAGTVSGRVGMTATQRPLSPHQQYCQPAASASYSPATPRAGNGVTSPVGVIDTSVVEPAGVAADRLLWVLRTLGVLGPSGQLTAAAYYVTAVVMEFADAGNLDSLSRGPQPCELRSAVELMRQVASGMSYLHAHGLVHGDLKPANVLLLRKPSSNHVVAKVADFGLSGLSGELGSDGGVQAVGTIAYSAPERLADGEDSSGAEQAADVYSFGICLRQLVSGERPFLDLTYGQIMFGVLCQGLRPVWAMGKPASDALQPLYDVCTVAEPQLRPTFEQIIAWLDKISRSHAADNNIDDDNEA